MTFFCSLASSSSGNAYVLCKKGRAILIDAGISCSRIISGLKALGLSPQDLSAVLVTHEHSDHTKGLRVLLKRTGATVYMTHGTRRALGLESERIHTYVAGEGFDIDNMRIASFKTPHDAAESVGFRIDTGSFSLGFATDMGYMPADGERLLRGVDVAVIEANYDRDMLSLGPYPYFIKRRISSSVGHQENSDCGDLAARLIKNGARSIMLAHISRNNNTPELAQKTVCSRLSLEGICIGRDIELHIAPPDSPGETLMIG